MEPGGRVREFKRSVCCVLGEKEKENKGMKPAKESVDILKMSGGEQMGYVGGHVVSNIWPLSFLFFSFFYYYFFFKLYVHWAGPLQKWSWRGNLYHINRSLHPKGISGFFCLSYYSRASSSMLKGRVYLSAVKVNSS